MVSVSPAGQSTTTLRIVAGKGGVGRTTVAAALAARAAAKGKRVLAVDAIGTGDLGRLVDADPTLGGFEVLRLTTGEALDQYLRIYLRLPIGPRRLGPLTRIFDYVSAAAPGVREILVIGKIGWEVRSGEWDEIVVDGPATGHVVELLDAPRTMAELVPTGPLADQTGWLRDIMASPRTGVVVVSSPDELSVSETGELVERLRNETETDVRLVVANRVPPSIDGAGRDEAADLVSDGAALARLAELAIDRHEVAETGIARLATIGSGPSTGEVDAETTEVTATPGVSGAPVIVVDDDPGDPIGRVLAGLDQFPASGWTA